MTVGSISSSNAQAQYQARATLAAAGQARAKEQSSQDMRSDLFGTSATNVTLSDKAKATIAAQKGDAAALDLLAKNDPAKGLSPDFTLDDVFKQSAEYLSEHDYTPQIKDSPLGKIAPIDPEALQEASMSLMVHSVEHRDPDGAAALHAALADGSVRVFKATSVPGVDMNTETIINTTSMGTSVSFETTTSLSPEAQKLVDSGRAYTMHVEGVGDLYMTW